VDAPKQYLLQLSLHDAFSHAKHASACTILQGKWDKIRQGKVLVCQPPGTAKPYLQFQTSGQVVATAYAQTALTQVHIPDISCKCH